MTGDVPMAQTHQLEQTLEQLLQSLLEMGICASDVQDSALETSFNGAASGSAGGLLGRKVTQTLEHLARLTALEHTVADVYIPLDVIDFVDAGKNPVTYTRDFIERVAGENMYTNGILSAVTDYRDLLNAQMVEAFPELAGLMETKSETISGDPIATNPIPPIPHYNSTNGEDESAQHFDIPKGSEDSMELEG